MQNMISGDADKLLGRSMCGNGGSRVNSLPGAEDPGRGREHQGECRQRVFAIAENPGRTPPTLALWRSSVVA